MKTSVVTRRICTMFEPIFDCIENHFGSNRAGLHEPVLGDVEKRYLNQVIDSGFVSTAGEMVGEFERDVARRVGAKHAVAVVNGTAALQLSLLACGVMPSDEVVTQSLTFIATANAIHHCGASPVFVDVESENLGMSASALLHWLQENVEVCEGLSINRHTGKVVRACMPMHTFGMSVEIDAIEDICRNYGIALVEDSAEALGASFKGRSLGTFGRCGVFSFNGNKLITTGGGGMIVTDCDVIAAKTKHLSTTAKIDAYRHDVAAFNYRMPNLNAALGCAQLTRIDELLERKRNLAKAYEMAIGKVDGVTLLVGLDEGKSNNWLLNVLCDSVEIKESLASQAKERNIQTRSVWQLLHRSAPYRNCQTGVMQVCESVADRVLSLPSMPTRMP